MFLTLIGEGEILARLEALKKKLEKEKLFDPERKKPLPVLPRNIGIITSENAAAFEDIKRTFYQNNIHAHVYLFPCSVQGNLAAGEISSQIQNANRYKNLDVLLIARGGGSIEDLLPFSEEVVVRAIAASHIPVISGVGHEIDTPLCELAADIRAHTPTDAAERICQQFNRIEEHILNIQETLHTNFSYIIQEKKALIQQFHPQALTSFYTQKINTIRQKIDTFIDTITNFTQYKLNENRNHIRHLETVLRETSPHKILSRGYALIYNKEKNITSYKGRQFIAKHRGSYLF